MNGGRLAPGLCQQLVVQFTGQELQHYQDTILVHTEVSGAELASKLSRHVWVWYGISGTAGKARVFGWLGHSGSASRLLAASTGFQRLSVWY